MKNNRYRLYTIAMLCSFTVILGFTAALAWDIQQSREDYQGYDLSRPWFDGKPWDWMLDMYNMPHIKPQEAGSIQQFPLDSVPRQGVEPKISEKTMRNGRLLRDQIPTNRVEVTDASIKNGRKFYVIYCATCHGMKGEGNTVVVKKGMPSPPILDLIPLLSEAHLYNKIRYGGALMPAYGYQTTQRERWDMVNYLKSKDFKE